jgi:hypothetical protein
MALLRKLLTLPVSGPISGAIWVAERVLDAADAEISDPATIRRSLDALERALDRGEIDEEEYDRREAELFARLQAAGRGGGGP